MIFRTRSDIFLNNTWHVYLKKIPDCSIISQRFAIWATHQTPATTDAVRRSVSRLWRAWTSCMTISKTKPWTAWKPRTSRNHVVNSMIVLTMSQVALLGSHFFPRPIFLLNSCSLHQRHTNNVLIKFNILSIGYSFDSHWAFVILFIPWFCLYPENFIAGVTCLTRMHSSLWTQTFLWPVTSMRASMKG